MSDAEEAAHIGSPAALAAALNGLDGSLDKAELFGIGELAGRILEGLNVWLNIHDENLNMVSWNRVAERLSGYLADEVLGHAKAWSWCYPDQDYRLGIQHKAGEIVQGGQTVVRFQNEIVCRNGERRCMSWNSHPLVDTSGQIRGAITVGYDITDFERSQEALKRVNEELSVLYDVASVASESLELDAILTRCLERVLATLGGDGGMVHLVKEGESELQLVAHIGIPNSLCHDFSHAASGRGFIGCIHQLGQSMRVPDIAADPRSTLSARRSGLTSYIGVPMRSKGKILGVFSLVGREPGTLLEKDMTLLSSIGDQIGLTVENAMLRKQAENLARQEERGRLAREIQDSVTQSIRQVTAGQTLPATAAPAPVVGQLADESTEPAGATESELNIHAGLEQLTDRECDVLMLVARGLSNREIGQDLGISERTVRTHVGHLLDKLGLSNRTQAALLAVRQGLVSL